MNRNIINATTPNAPPLLLRALGSGATSSTTAHTVRKGYRMSSYSEVTCTLQNCHAEQSQPEPAIRRMEAVR